MCVTRRSGLGGVAHRHEIRVAPIAVTTAVVRAGSIAVSLVDLLALFERFGAREMCHLDYCCLQCGMCGTHAGRGNKKESGKRIVGDD